jgi:hypothetical protein
MQSVPAVGRGRRRVGGVSPSGQIAAIAERQRAAARGAQPRRLSGSAGGRIAAIAVRSGPQHGAGSPSGGGVGVAPCFGRTAWSAGRAGAVGVRSCAAAWMAAARPPGRVPGAAPWGSRRHAPPALIGPPDLLVGVQGAQPPAAGVQGGRGRSPWPGCGAERPQWRLAGVRGGAPAGSPAGSTSPGAGRSAGRESGRRHPRRASGVGGDRQRGAAGQLAQLLCNHTLLSLIGARGQAGVERQPDTNVRKAAVGSGVSSR